MPAILIPRSSLPVNVGRASNNIVPLTRQGSPVRSALPPTVPTAHTIPPTAPAPLSPSTSPQSPIGGVSTGARAAQPGLSNIPSPNPSAPPASRVEIPRSATIPINWDSDPSKTPFERGLENGRRLQDSFDNEFGEGYNRRYVDDSLAIYTDAKWMNRLGYKNYGDAWKDAAATIGNAMQQKLSDLLASARELNISFPDWLQPYPSNTRTNERVDAFTPGQIYQWGFDQAGSSFRYRREAPFSVFLRTTPRPGSAPGFTMEDQLIVQIQGGPETIVATRYYAGTNPDYGEITFFVVPEGQPMPQVGMPGQPTKAPLDYAPQLMLAPLTPTIPITLPKAIPATQSPIEAEPQINPLNRPAAAPGIAPGRRPIPKSAPDPSPNRAPGTSPGTSPGSSPGTLPGSSPGTAPGASPSTPQRTAPYPPVDPVQTPQQTPDKSPEPEPQINPARQKPGEGECCPDPMDKFSAIALATVQPCDKELPSQRVSVPNPLIEIVKFQSEQIKKLGELICGQQPIASVPEWWQIRPEAQRPQLAILYAEVYPSGKLGTSRWTLHLPHYNRPKGYKPNFPQYNKGNYEGILVLKDNSKIIVNAASTTECKRVLNNLKIHIPVQYRTGTDGKAIKAKVGERINSDLKKCRVVAVRADFYSNGMKNLIPDWSIDLRGKK